LSARLISSDSHLPSRVAKSPGLNRRRQLFAAPASNLFARPQRLPLARPLPQSLFLSRRVPNSPELNPLLICCRWPASA